MADLTDIQAAQTVKIAGASPSTGVKDNFAEVDSNGRLLTSNSPVDGYKQTYSASITALTVAALATDIFTITGSATKTVRITSVQISGTQTTSGFANVLIIKRSTANTGGTSTSRTIVPHDSTNTAATATVNAYTANPTLGTIVGAIRADKLIVAITVPSGSEYGMAILHHIFGSGPSQAIVLRGTSEVLSVNLNAATFTGNSFNLDITWTEE